MGCFAKIKPLRASAKDSKTGCCTMVKVMAFYTFGCSGCRKARKKVPKDIRGRFAAAWKHEVELGTKAPLTPVESREPWPHPAEVQRAGEKVDSKIWDENTQKYLPWTSRPPKVVKATSKREFSDYSDPMKGAVRKNYTLHSPDSNAHSLALKNSTPEEREWMFLAPESARHMRAIRQHGYTWFMKEGDTGVREQVSRGHAARAAREEAEQREKESNGRERWEVRERVVLDGDYFRGTNIWEAFCLEKLEPSAQDPVSAETALGNAPEDNVMRSVSEERHAVELASIESVRKERSRSSSPHPPPLPVWPVASASSGTLETISSSPDSTPRFRRHSGDTTETRNTDLTTPDDSPWLKEAMESPLPATPMTSSPALLPSTANMTLADYFPILAHPASDLSASIPDPKVPDCPILESPVTDLSAETMTLMDLLQSSKYAYKPHLAWEQWRAQRRSALLVSEKQQVVLKEFGEKGPTYLPPPIELKRSASVFRDWRPWPQSEKKPEVQQVGLTLSSSHQAEVAETIAEEGKAISKPPKKLMGQKVEGKGKAKEFAGWEVSSMVGFMRFRDDCLWRDEGEAPFWQRDWTRASLISVESLMGELSAADGGVGASCGRGTEEYERRKEGLGEWEPGEWEKKKKALDSVIAEGLKNAKGTREYERAREYERIMKAEKERRERESKWTW